jgi:CubicO group peptidase (beta-lactamase class C family)
VRVRRRVLVLAAGLLSACTPPERHFPAERELTALLETRVRERRSVGIAVGVLEADGSVTTAFAGDAGEGARPLGAGSGFEIGSITKTFTGILLAEMVRTGDVRYDDPVSRYLPQGVRVPSLNGREITLLDLATHHSGLPAMPDNMDPADPSNPYADYSVAQMYAFLAGFRPEREAGAAYQYSNIGFGLLGHALARAAGSGYDELVRERILAPLRLEGTAIELRGELGERMAKGHNRQGDIVPYWDLPTLAGAGAYRSNLDDLMRFLAANLRATDSDLERSIRATHKVQRTVSDTTANRIGIHAMGMGWQIRSRGDARIVWKDGGTAGFQTFIGFDPERRIGVVVLSNTAIEVDDIGFHLLDPGSPLGAPPPMPASGS